MTDVLHLLADRIQTPIGEMVIVMDEDGNLRAMDWKDHEVRMAGSSASIMGKKDSASKPLSV